MRRYEIQRGWRVRAHFAVFSPMVDGQVGFSRSRWFGVPGQRIIQLVLWAQMIQGCGKVLQVGGGMLAGVDFREQGRLGCRCGLWKGGRDGGGDRIRGLLQGPVFQGRQFVETRPAHFAEEKNESAPVNSFEFQPCDRTPQVEYLMR